MKAVIMAGGEGTRLRSVTGLTPKPMALLAGKPVLERILALLRQNGVSEVRISLRYRPHVIMDYFGSGESLGMNISYSVESAPLGTAGGVRACSDFYGDRDFLVISGDCACDFDLRQLMEAHRRHGSAVTMALYSHESPLRYGTVLTDTLGRVVSFVEKPSWRRVVSDFVNTGVYVVSPEAMELVPEGQFFDFAKDLFPLLLKRGMELRGVPMQGYWCDIGTPRAYYRCNLDALDGKLRLDPPPEGEPEPEPEYLPRAVGEVRELPCSNRAGVMRCLSRYMMEAGADFSDGISLDTAKGRVHIAPEADKSALRIEAGTPELADEYERLARSLDADIRE